MSLLLQEIDRLLESQDFSVEAIAALKEMAELAENQLQEAKEARQYYADLLREANSEAEGLRAECKHLAEQLALANSRSKSPKPATLEARLKSISKRVEDLESAIGGSSEVDLSPHEEVKAIYNSSPKPAPEESQTLASASEYPRIGVSASGLPGMMVMPGVCLDIAGNVGPGF